MRLKTGITSGVPTGRVCPPYGISPVSTLRQLPAEKYICLSRVPRSTVGIAGKREPQDFPCLMDHTRKKAAEEIKVDAGWSV